MRGYGDDPWRNAMQGVGFLGNAMRIGQQIGEVRHGQDERDATNKAYEYITGKLGGSGDLSALDGDSILNTRHGVQAMGKFMLDRANTEQSRLSMLKNMEAADDQFYQNTFRPLAFEAQKAYQSGDMRRFGQIVSELSAKSPLPYRYELGQDGDFAESFRSSKEGKFIDTGERMTPQQVFEQLNGIMSGEQRVLRGADMQMQTVNPRFLAASARYKMGTILGNAQALSEPNQWIPLTKGGKTIYVIPQNRHDDYSVGPSYRIVDDKGGMGGMMGSLDDLMSQGWVRADVKAKIDNAQRIASGRGLGGGRGGGSGGNLSASDLSFIKDASTITDDMGNKSVNTYKGMGLEALMGRMGYSRFSALQVYNQIYNEAVSKAVKNNPNIPREEITQRAHEEVCNTILGGGTVIPQNAPEGTNTTGTGNKTGSGFFDFSDKIKALFNDDNGYSQEVHGTQQDIPEGAEIVRLSSWPEEKWAYIGDDGKPVEITKEQAKQVMSADDNKPSQGKPWFSPIRKQQNPDGTMSLVRK